MEAIFFGVKGRGLGYGLCECIEKHQKQVRVERAWLRQSGENFQKRCIKQLHATCVGLVSPPDRKRGHRNEAAGSSLKSLLLREMKRSFQY